MKTMTVMAFLVMLVAVIRQSIALAVARHSPVAQAQLAATSSGRIALHFVCAWRDHKLQWHGRGVVRELFSA